MTYQFVTVVYVSKVMLFFHKSEHCLLCPPLLYLDLNCCKYLSPNIAVYILECCIFLIMLNWFIWDFGFHICINACQKIF
uniref:Uncharacterized protein n=1 Tax=Arundo donax TaxID=35708 RepID=A0A0A8ZBR1_ARUDO